MAVNSRLQINFERLLNVCEKQAATSSDSEWRFQKFVEDLQQKLVLLNKESCNKPHPEVLKDYQKRVDVLHGILTAEKQESPSEKVKVVRSIPLPKISSYPERSGDSVTSQSKDALLHTKAKFSNQSRRALLGDGGDGLRQRGGTSTTSPESDLDSILLHHQQQQERLADDMVQMARCMKDHAKAASHIVQDDNKKLEEANKLADTNYTQLKVESGRLEDHTKKSSCWMMLLLLFIIIVFVWMVIFMKIFPKPKI